MSQKYLLRCSECDKDFPISSKRAGMDVNCPFCDQVLNIPGMREIQELPLAEEKASTNGPDGSDFKRFLFSAGLLVGVLGLLTGLALSYYADSLATELRVEEKIEFGNAFVDTMTQGRLWETWDQMATKGLPDWQESQDVRYNKQAGHLKSISYGLLGIGGLGLLTALASFFLGGQK